MRHLKIAQRRCPDVEQATAVRSGVPAPDGGAGLQRAVRPGSWHVSFSAPRRRSATGCARRTGTRGVVRPPYEFGARGGAAAWFARETATIPDSTGVRVVVPGSPCASVGAGANSGSAPSSSARAGRSETRGACRGRGSQLRAPAGRRSHVMPRGLVVRRTGGPPVRRRFTGRP